MSPYHITAEPESLKATYHSVEKTLEELAERDLVNFSDSLEDEETALLMGSVLLNQQIKENRIVLEDALTRIGYEKSVGIGTTYIRHNGDYFEILSDRLLHDYGAPSGLCFYRTELDFSQLLESFGPLRIKEERKEAIKEIAKGSVIIGSAMVPGIMLMQYGYGVIGSILSVAGVIGGIATSLYSIMKSFDREEVNYKTSIGLVAESDQALLEAVKPTAEHKKIMAPKVRVENEKEELEPTQRQRFMDYMRMDVIDLLKGKRPKVRVDITEEEQVEVEELASAETERQQ